MAQKFAHEEECEIVRGDSSYDIAVPGQAVLMDNEGDRIFSVPESWTDEQIWQCLKIANRFYEAGVSRGEREKARETAKALFLKC